MRLEARASFVPSPRLRGEGAERARSVRKAGEGALRVAQAFEEAPHPVSSLCSETDLSPQAGRGEESAEIAR